ncbi:MAG TPA: hypothetical protein VLW50_13270 [Streptosporangiaceae bacterium]|nr:hypothetical protein [Streptosporangiaceae bacterium]
MLLLLDDGSGGPIAGKPARPWDRLLVRLRAGRLDRDLACGARPETNVELALRAQMLVRVSARRDLARGAQRILAAATQPSASRRLAVPVCRDRVRHAAEEFGELIRRLSTPGPVAARGVAQASVLLGDASGPLYHRGNAEDLRARVREAVDALRPQSNW